MSSDCKLACISLIIIDKMQSIITIYTPSLGESQLVFKIDKVDVFCILIKKNMFLYGLKLATRGIMH
jgi:hypothetical protein